jgi:glycosyltransferase involved in cell wall biosynthesis
MRNKNIQVIHNGIDLNVFKPPPEKKSSKDKKLIAFGAFDVNDWNKGGGELLEALRILRDKYKREFELLLIGNGRFDDEFKVKNTGFISSDADIAPIYPQADVFVLASKYDNLPNMLVEASACGVPLVGFDTGGIPDIIKTGKNGYLAKAFNCEDLAHGLDFVLNDKNSIELSKNARESAEKNFDIKNIARQYIELYEEIING